MQNTKREQRPRHPAGDACQEEVRRRLVHALEQLWQARCALHVACKAVTAAEADLLLKRQERERVALRVAELADLVETLEDDVASHHTIG
jgi:hypothetical protein